MTFAAMAGNGGLAMKRGCYPPRVPLLRHPWDAGVLSSEFGIRRPVETHAVAGDKRGGLGEHDKALLRTKEHDRHAVDVGVEVSQRSSRSGGGRVNGYFR